MRAGCDGALPALRKQREEDHEVEASLGQRVRRCCQKTKGKRKVIYATECLCQSLLKKCESYLGKRDRENNSTKKVMTSQAWWYLPVIPALRRLTQENPKFGVSLGYIVKPCLKKTK
jgi:hypothetical protein